MLYRRSLVLGVARALALAAIAGIQLVGIPFAETRLAATQNHPAQETSALTSEGEPSYLRPAQRCPTDLQVLAPQLLNDLPSYANRVASRNLDLSRRPITPTSTVLVAGAPDFTPIDLGAIAPDDLAQGNTSALQQVFFTTLERQYLQNQVVSLQHHHWLFLAPSPEGWHLALLYSSLAPYPTGEETRPPTPPQESSDGIVGQAIRLWLRDCRAGAVFSDGVFLLDSPAIAP